MIIELASLPPCIVQYINAGQKVEIEKVEAGVKVTPIMPLHSSKNERTAGRLAMLLGQDDVTIDEQVLLAPLDEADWDSTDPYGIS